MYQEVAISIQLWISSSAPCIIITDCVKTISICCVCTRGHTSFWGDGYPICKWTRNLRTIFRNMYQAKEEKQMTHFKSPFTTGFIKPFSEIIHLQTKQSLSFHDTQVPSMIVRLILCSLRCVKIESHFLCTLYVLLPWFCIQWIFNIHRNLR